MFLFFLFSSVFPKFLLPPFLPYLVLPIFFIFSQFLGIYFLNILNTVTDRPDILWKYNHFSSSGHLYSGGLPSHFIFFLYCSFIVDVVSLFCIILLCIITHFSSICFCFSVFYILFSVSHPSSSLLNHPFPLSTLFISNSSINTYFINFSFNFSLALIKNTCLHKP